MTVAALISKLPTITLPSVDLIDGAGRLGTYVVTSATELVNHLNGLDVNTVITATGKLLATVGKYSFIAMIVVMVLGGVGVYAGICSCIPLAYATYSYVIYEKFAAPSRKHLFIESNRINTDVFTPYQTKCTEWNARLKALKTLSDIITELERQKTQEETPLDAFKTYQTTYTRYLKRFAELNNKIEEDKSEKNKIQAQLANELSFPDPDSETHLALVQSNEFTLLELDIRIQDNEKSLSELNEAHLKWMDQLILGFPDLDVMETLEHKIKVAVAKSHFKEEERLLLKLEECQSQDPQPKLMAALDEKIKLFQDKVAALESKLGSHKAKRDTEIKEFAAWRESANKMNAELAAWRRDLDSRFVYHTSHIAMTYCQASTWIFSIFKDSLIKFGCDLIKDWNNIYGDSFIKVYNAIWNTTSSIICPRISRILPRNYWFVDYLITLSVTIIGWLSYFFLKIPGVDTNPNEKTILSFYLANPEDQKVCVQAGTLLDQIPDFAYQMVFHFDLVLDFLRTAVALVVLITALVTLGGCDSMLILQIIRYVPACLILLYQFYQHVLEYRYHGLFDLHIPRLRKSEDGELLAAHSIQLYQEGYSFYSLAKEVDEYARATFNSMRTYCKSLCRWTIKEYKDFRADAIHFYLFWKDQADELNEELRKRSADLKIKLNNVAARIFSQLPSIRQVLTGVAGSGWSITKAFVVPIAKSSARLVPAPIARVADRASQFVLLHLREGVQMVSAPVVRARNAISQVVVPLAGTSANVLSTQLVRVGDGMSQFVLPFVKTSANVISAQIIRAGKNISHVVAPFAEAVGNGIYEWAFDEESEHSA